MDLIAPEEVGVLAAAIAAAGTVVPVGARTQWEVGGAVGDGAVEVYAPRGIGAFDPAELTVTVGAGTSVAELRAALGEAGQECVIDPRSPDATVGGVLAVGLSGHRRLRHGPLRDRVLEVRFVTADGRLVKGGGPTVKNVSGYDLPRLLVGSMGTLGVLVQATLRCQPQPGAAQWFTTDAPPERIRSVLYRPSCMAWSGDALHVLLEGHPDDVQDQRRVAGLDPSAAPPFPDGACRARISVAPATLRALLDALGQVEDLDSLAEIGVGTVHVAAPDSTALRRARELAEQHGGWLLRESGAPELDGWGRSQPNHRLHQRLRDAFDPDHKLSPGRMPR